MSEFSTQAYNAWWQARLDLWSQVEEEADRRVRSVDPERAGAMTDAIAHDLELLAHIERYWAYPGKDGFGRIEELFRTGGPIEFARAAAQVKRMLSADYSYGATEARSSTYLISDPVEAAEQAEFGDADQRYFEVLVVERMTTDQERALREDIRSWRRPDDEFVYDIVVVRSYEDAVDRDVDQPNHPGLRHQAAVRPQPRPRPGRLDQFVDPAVRDRLDRRSPQERAETLGERSGRHPAGTRPVPDDRDLARGRRRQSQPSLPPDLPLPRGTLELHLSMLDGVAHRYRTPVLQRAASVQPPPDRGRSMRCRSPRASRS